MKQIAGNGFGDRPKGDILDEVVRQGADARREEAVAVPGPAARDLDRRADQRGLRLDEEHRPDPRKRRRRPPVTSRSRQAEIHQLRDAVLAHGPTLCADCDGRCSVAAGTTAELGNLTRFLTYHQHHGDRTEARRQYAALSPEARDWSGADLEAARAACPDKLDFAKLLPEVERHLA